MLNSLRPMRPLLGARCLVLALHNAPALLGILLAALPTRLAAQDPTTAAPPSREAIDFFERQVRPVLVDHCLECHGPNAQEGGLRLDAPRFWQAGGDSGPVIEPGDPAASRLLSALRYDGDLQMPPEGPLEPHQVAAVERWIAEGAVWPADVSGKPADLIEQHWSFQPIEPGRVDLLTDDEAQTTEPTPAEQRFDRLITQHWIAEGWIEAKLPPTSPADARTRLRRVSYDLLGLPPSPRHVQRFAQDTRPDAWPRQIDRLMASPRFGERWARHWMDVSRYADNKGYVFFERQDFPWAYTYRDYLIRALNDDRTYDRFLVEQLAADQLSDLDQDADLAALGFLTTGGHFINNTHDIIDDRIDVISRGLLGLTLSCARCHDHKYDPLTAGDYYGWYGILSSCYEPLVPPPLDPSAAATLDDYNAELEKRRQDLESFVLGKHAALVDGARRRVDEYLQAVEHRRRHPSAEDFMLIADPDDINPAMITRWEAYLETTATPDHPVWGPWAWAWEQTTHDAQQHLDWDEPLAASSWNPRLISALQQEHPTTLDELAQVYGQLFREVVDVEVESLDEPEAAQAVAQLKHELFGTGTPPDLSVQLDWGFLSLFPDRATQNVYKEKLGALEKWLTDPPEAPARAMVLFDQETPADAPIFLRGNPHRRGPVVPRHFLDFFAPQAEPFRQGSGRRQLARAIVAGDNPLTDRVHVNRIWMHLFGEPLVATPGDLGMRSPRPELLDVLDDLVVQFRRHDRHAKRLIYDLVTSRTYQQASQADPAVTRWDPENRWYARQNAKRLDYEAMRDTLLAAAGRLSSRVGGPSEDQLAQLTRRRSLYHQINRLDVAPVLTTFDVPNPAATSPQRTRTMVPPQALFWMNRPEIITLAEEIWRRPEIQQTSPAARVDRTIEVLWSRPPTAEERDASYAFLGWDPRASSTSAAGAPNADPPSDTRWIQWIHALLMANETVFID